MSWVRKILGSFLWLVLLVSLLGTAFSTSAYIAFNHPQKLEKWISQSNLYGHFISNSISQAKKSVGSSADQASLTLSDTVVQQAATSAFTTGLFQQSVNKVIDSNYSWLEGKTSQPSFTVDLSQAKENFANQVGKYVQTYITNLPACSPKELTTLASAKTVDPLNITCKPPNLIPKTEADIVSQRILTSNMFLRNPVLTASNLNPDGSKSSQPYYQRFSRAPSLYQAAVRLPWIYAATALICALGVLFLASRKRFGLRRVSVSLIISGVVLVITGLVGNSALTHINHHISASKLNTQLQQAFVSIVSQAGRQLTKIDLYFGIAYLILATVFLLILVFTRNRKPRQKVTFDNLKPYDTIFTRFRNDPKNSVPPPKEPRPLPPQLEPQPQPQPRPKKRPRLIQ